MFQKPSSVPFFITSKPHPKRVGGFPLNSKTGNTIWI